MMRSFKNVFKGKPYTTWNNIFLLTVMLKIRNGGNGNRNGGNGFHYLSVYIYICACVVADIELVSCFYVSQGSVKQHFERQKYLHYE